MGTVLSWTTYLAFAFTLWIRNYAHLEFCLSSIDRLMRYRTLQTEQDEANCVNPGELFLPVTEGKVEFQDVTMKYSKEGPKILKAINLVCHPGEKVVSISLF